MVRACRYALAGQVGALLALVAVEILPFGRDVAAVALTIACGLEAVGYGAGGLAAVGGVARAGRPVLDRVVQAVLSLVLWGLGVRHVLLVPDPMGGDPALSAPSTWGVVLAVWLLLLGVGARRADGEAASWRVRGAWLVGIAVLGAVNTLAMAAVRTLV